MIDKSRYRAGSIQLRRLVLLAFITVSSPAIPAHDEDGQSGRDVPPGAIFSALLPDIPGQRLTVFRLEFEPKKEGTTAHPHRHPGPVYVYVTKGSVRWAIEGEPARILDAGDSFFEPAGVLHTAAENASTTEPATVLAVMIVPDGAPLVIRE